MGCLHKPLNPVNPVITHDVLKRSLKVTQEEYKSPNFSCVPGETFQLECNNCKCDETGKSALWCTRKGCPKNFPTTPSTNELN